MLPIRARCSGALCVVFVLGPLGPLGVVCVGPDTRRLAYSPRVLLLVIYTYSNATSTIPRALNEHPEQIRAAAARRRWRITAIKIRFIALVARMLRERACEHVLVPLLQERRLGKYVVAGILAWYQCRHRQELARHGGP